MTERFNTAECQAASLLYGEQTEPTSPLSNFPTKQRSNQDSYKQKFPQSNVTTKGCFYYKPMFQPICVWTNQYFYKPMIPQTKACTETSVSINQRSYEPTFQQCNVPTSNVISNNINQSWYQPKLLETDAPPDRHLAACPPPSSLFLHIWTPKLDCEPISCKLSSARPSLWCPRP